MRASSFFYCGLTTALCIPLGQSAFAAPAPVKVAPVKDTSAKIAKKPKFSLSRFQESDGAIPILVGGERVDAYFATKALLTAHGSGYDIQQAGTKWVNWLLPRQTKDGLFERYKRRIGTDGKTAGWDAIDIADADDALMALWIELLYVLSSDRGLSVEWQHSIWLAGDHLATLRDGRGIYLISRTNRVGLLMDNVEIYGAFQSIARERMRMKESENAIETATRSGELGEAIRQTFWDTKAKRFRISTQDIPGDEFYPHAVAQVYPLLTDLRTPGTTDHIILDKWLARYGYDWLWLKQDEFPWGLVALVAWKKGDINTAHAWQMQHKSLRYGGQWTVLDEAVYQSLAVLLPKNLGVPKPDPRLMPKPVAIAPKAVAPKAIAPKAIAPKAIMPKAEVPKPVAKMPQMVS